MLSRDETKIDVVLNSLGHSVSNENSVLKIEILEIPKRVGNSKTEATIEVRSPENPYIH